MLNQSFSAENFRRIFDLENRKGVFLEGKYFPQLKDITEKIKDCNKNIKREKKEKVSNGNDELKKLYEERKLLKKEKSFSWCLLENLKV